LGGHCFVVFLSQQLRPRALFSLPKTIRSSCQAMTKTLSKGATNVGSCYPERPNSIETDPKHYKNRLGLTAQPDPLILGLAGYLDSTSLGLAGQPHPISLGLAWQPYPRILLFVL